MLYALVIFPEQQRSFCQNCTNGKQQIPDVYSAKADADVAFIPTFPQYLTGEQFMLAETSLFHYCCNGI
jgi:hypothetical protein